MRGAAGRGADAGERPVNADLDTLQALIAPLFPGTMGVRLVEVSAERVRAELQVPAIQSG